MPRRRATSKKTEISSVEHKVVKAKARYGDRPTVSTTALTKLGSALAGTSKKILRVSPFQASEPLPQNKSPSNDDVCLPVNTFVEELSAVTKEKPLLINQTNLISRQRNGSSTAQCCF